MSYKIGFIDEDIKQVKKFTRALREYGFAVIGYDIRKGMSIEELIEQIYSSDIDLLMIDYFLKDKGILTFNGDEIERRYNEIKPNFPHIIFTSNEGDAFKKVDNPNIIYEKEMVTEDKDHFLKILEKNIETYRFYIDKRKRKIEELLLKGEKVGLSSIEQNILLTNQRDLKGLDKLNQEVPEKFISVENLDDLSNTRKEAEKFLQSLIKKRKKNDDKN